MSKKEITLIALEAALKRIIEGQPTRISDQRKISVRAVEEEANLGNGSGYYYPEFVEKVKQVKADVAQAKGEYVQPEIQSVRIKLNEQKRIKQNYKEKYEAVKQQLADFAAAQHHLNDKLVKALSDIDELKFENERLNEQLVKLRRSKIVPMK
ncbi:hypothetical protein [Motilimonas cestriensis]|uniref:Uncharacterized protein n=1 Tax=Motilimonas cestriensis TaxID=2742685 RepID=A0ABS8WA16_9GAMM|nr:hypothetical protein [Motilimonas cestriensis]MCE2595859.1 hypothetical protein [Motilimonas cestriensis]